MNSFSVIFIQTRYTNGTIVNETYYYANGKMLVKKNNEGDKFYYHPDHLGSTTLVTNQSGDVAEEIFYLPYGGLLDGNSDERFQYTGQEKDKETGFQYYGARYYDSDFRRFLQPDPIIADIYDPQNLNRYSYVLNNPYKYVDPSGNEAVYFELIITGGAFDNVAGRSYGLVNTYRASPLVGFNTASSPSLTLYTRSVDNGGLAPATTSVSGVIGLTPSPLVSSFEDFKGSVVNLGGSALTYSGAISTPNGDASSLERVLMSSFEFGRSFDPFVPINAYGLEYSEAEKIFQIGGLNIKKIVNDEQTFYTPIPIREQIERYSYKGRPPTNECCWGWDTDDQEWYYVGSDDGGDQYE